MQHVIENVAFSTEQTAKFDFIKHLLRLRPYSNHRKMIHSQPGRRSLPGHVTVRPLRE